MGFRAPRGIAREVVETFLRTEARIQEDGDDKAKDLDY